MYHNLDFYQCKCNPAFFCQVALFLLIPRIAVAGIAFCVILFAILAFAGYSFFNARFDLIILATNRGA